MLSWNIVKDKEEVDRYIKTIFDMKILQGNITLKYYSRKENNINYI